MQQPQAKLAEQSDEWLIVQQLMHEPMPIEDLADVLDESLAATREVLSAMEARGYIECDANLWSLTDRGRAAA